MKYHFKIHKEKDGFWGECLELKGCHTQADDLFQLQLNMEEALNLYLSEPINSTITFPLPRIKKNSSQDIVEVPVEANVAFAMLLRLTRLKHKLSLRQMAKQLHYKSLNSYVKLEKANCANPQLKTIANIKKVFTEFPIELVLS